MIWLASQLWPGALLSFIFGFVITWFAVVRPRSEVEGSALPADVTDEAGRPGDDGGGFGARDGVDDDWGEPARPTRRRSRELDELRERESVVVQRETSGNDTLAREVTHREAFADDGIARDAGADAATPGAQDLDAPAEPGDETAADQINDTRTEPVIAPSEPEPEPEPRRAVRARSVGSAFSSRIEE